MNALPKDTGPIRSSGAAHGSALRGVRWGRISIRIVVGVVALLALALAGRPGLAAPLDQAGSSGGGLAPLAGDSLAAPLNFINIGDFVWYDTNHDGVQDPGEAGINGVQVVLYLDNGDKICGAGDTFVNQMYTGPNPNTPFNPGWYNFAIQAPLQTTYYCVYIDPANFGPGGALQGYTPTNDDVITSPWLVTITPGTTGNLDIDFGYIAVDWGDLPDQPYPTLSASNGPHHYITSPLVLGATVDAEVDGQPDATATGDDTHGRVPDDETGVTVKPGMAGSPTWTDGAVSSLQGGSLQIVISGGNGVPQVFIDFQGGPTTLAPITLQNSSGGALPTTPWTPGTYQVYFDVPAGAMANDPNIPVRVRLSSTGGLGTTGEAPDGEVEDYIFSFKTTAVSMASFTAGPAANLPLVGLGGAALVALLAVWSRRQHAAAQHL